LKILIAAKKLIERLDGRRRAEDNDTKNNEAAAVNPEKISKIAQQRKRDRQPYTEMLYIFNGKSYCCNNTFTDIVILLLLAKNI